MTTINKECEIISRGGILLHKTDTIWGLACDALNLNSIHKIYRIKKRPSNKPLIILVNSLEMLQKYVYNVPKNITDKIKKFDKPSTIIYSNPKNLPQILIHNNSIAIRITKNKKCKEIINTIKNPIVSTSANISGEPFPKKFSEINSLIKKSVDYIIKEKNEDNKSDDKVKPSLLYRINKKQELEHIDR